MDIYGVRFHPLVVHFPIALIISAMFFEILSHISKKESLHRTAYQIFIVASLIIPFVVVTGLWEADAQHLVKHRVLDLHKFFAFGTLILTFFSFCVLWFLEKKKSAQFRKIFLILLIFSSCFVSLAAYNGGRLVYEYAVGVEK